MRPPLAVGEVWSASNQQVVYRRLLKAFSYPGVVSNLGGFTGSDDALTAVLATLLDHTVSLADPHELLTSNQIGLLGCQITTIDQAGFIVCDGKRSISSSFNPRIGTLYRPELGATVLIRCESVETGSVQLMLTGPGIKEVEILKLEGIERSWFEFRDVWNSGFPTGVDLILCDQNCIVGLPRTTSVQFTS